MSAVAMAMEMHRVQYERANRLERLLVETADGLDILAATFGVDPMFTNEAAILSRRIRQALP